MNKCIGCGIKLQNKEVKKLGYTKNLENKYCERCFKTIHYNIETKINNIDNLEVINKINKLGYFTIFITDLLNINNKLINIYKNINNKKVLVINKCDIIPNNLKLEHLEENIKRVYNIEDVFFISAKKELYLNRIIDLIEINQNVIICGETSSGKSTLINNLLDTKLTTSKYSNTTLDFIKLKLDQYVIYDTPGLIINDNKTNVDNIVIYTKKLSNDFVLTIGDIKIMGTGNITCILDSNIKITSKKEDVKLDYNIEVSNSDILLDNGFIFIKENAIVKSNQKLSVRDSIIK